MATQSLGITYEEMGQYDKALATYHTLTVGHKGIYQGPGLLDKARILELQKKPAEAIKLYKEVVKIAPKGGGRLATMERKLKQELQLLNLFAKNPNMKDKARIQQLQYRYFRTMQQLSALREAAAVYDPAYFAKKRLAFLDLGLTLDSQAIPAPKTPAEPAPATAPKQAPPSAGIPGAKPAVPVPPVASPKPIASGRPAALPKPAGMGTTAPLQPTAVPAPGKPTAGPMAPPISTPAVPPMATRATPAPKPVKTPVMK